MRKTATILIVLAMLAIATPATADPPTEYTYTGAAGYYLGDLPSHPAAGCHDADGDEEADACIPSGRGYSVVFFPNSNESFYTNNGINPIGGVRYFSSDGKFYQNGIFTPDDEAFAANVGTSACFYDPDGDTTCDPYTDDGDIDVQADWVCGEVKLNAPAGSTVTYDRATIWIRTASAYDDFGEVCGGSTGVIEGDMF